MVRVKNWTDFNSFSFSTIKINENSSTEVLGSENKKAEDEIRKQLEKDGISVGDVTIVFSSDNIETIENGATGTSTSVIKTDKTNKTDARTSDGDDKLGSLADVVAKAAISAREGFGKPDGSDSLFYGSSKDPDREQKIKNFFFGGGGGGGVETIGGGGPGLIAFSSSTLNSGIDASNQKTFQSKKAQEFSKENPALGNATQKLAQPNYAEIGKPLFAGSNDYKETLDAIGKNRKSALNFLENLGVDTDQIGKKDNCLVAVRSTLDIKNQFPNDFTDFFILFKSDGDIDTFLGSTTPSPAYRVKEWYDYFIKLGFVKLIAQQGSYVLDPGVYEFTLKDNDVKSKYFGMPILQQDDDVSFHKYGLEKSPAEAKSTDSYNPGPNESGNIQLCITPALPDGKNANGLDATTSGDQVIKNSSSFEEILKAVKTNPDRSIKYILAENKKLKSRKEKREERREEKNREKQGEEATKEVSKEEKVNESLLSKGMKYLKKFDK